jgi:hypothetical protein
MQVAGSLSPLRHKDRKYHEGFLSVTFCLCVLVAKNKSLLKKVFVNNSKNGNVNEEGYIDHIK